MTKRKTDLSIRGEMLDEAKGLVTGDRNAVYGPPNQDFRRTADMASAWGFQVDGKPLQSHHVAIFVDLIKTSRLKWTPTKRDSWVDKAGYAACGLECALIDAGHTSNPVANDDIGSMETGSRPKQLKFWGRSCLKLVLCAFAAGLLIAGTVLIVLAVVGVL